MPPTTETKKFPLFTSLPLELQIKVWELSVRSRIVTLMPGGGPAPSLFSVCRQSRAISRPKYYLIQLTGSYVSVPALKLKKVCSQGYDKKHKSRIKPPAFFSIYINYTLDYLYLTPIHVVYDSTYRLYQRVRFYMEDILRGGREPGEKNACAAVIVQRYVEEKSLLGPIKGVVLDLEDSVRWKGQGRRFGYWCWKLAFEFLLSFLPSLERVLFVPDGTAKRGLRFEEMDVLYYKQKDLHGAGNLESGQAWRASKKQTMIMEQLPKLLEEAKTNPVYSHFHNISTEDLKSRNLDFQLVGMRKTSRLPWKRRDANCEDKDYARKIDRVLDQLKKWRKNLE